MSLYDKYFSSKNKQYVYSLLSNLILKETGQDIQNDELYLELYKFHYPKIFSDFSSDSLVELNKSLLDTVGDKILVGIQRSYREKKITVTKSGPDDTDAAKEQEPSEEPQKKDISYLNIYSSDRDIELGHRYDYDVSVDEAIFRLHKVTIPSEGNSLSLPTIQVELSSQGESVTITCCANETKRVGDRDYIVYSPQLQVAMPVQDTIHVRLLDQRGFCPSPEIDISPITQLKHVDSKSTCLKYEEASALAKDDIYGLYENGEYSQTLRILKIQSPYLLVDRVPLKDEVTYSIVNLSVQNHLVFSTESQ
jgi:hypothetical protein